MRALVFLLFLGFALACASAKDAVLYEKPSSPQFTDIAMYWKQRGSASVAFIFYGEEGSRVSYRVYEGGNGLSIKLIFENALFPLHAHGQVALDPLTNDLVTGIGIDVRSRSVTIQVSRPSKYVISWKGNAFFIDFTGVSETEW